MKPKSILASKTFWLQILALVAVLFPACQAWLAENPVQAVAVLGAANILVRFVTSGKISIFGDGETDATHGGASGGMLPLLVIGFAAAALMALPSCSPSQLAVLKQMPLRACLVTDQGNLCYSTKSGLSAEVDASSHK